MLRRHVYNNGTTLVLTSRYYCTNRFYSWAILAGTDVRVRVRGVRSTWRTPLVEQSVGLHRIRVYGRIGVGGGGGGRLRGGCDDGGVRIVDRAPACYYTLALLYISSLPSHAWRNDNRFGVTSRRADRCQRLRAFGSQNHPVLHDSQHPFIPLRPSPNHT